MENKFWGRYEIKRWNYFNYGYFLHERYQWCTCAKLGIKNANGNLARD